MPRPPRSRIALAVGLRAALVLALLAACGGDAARSPSPVAPGASPIDSPAPGATDEPAATPAGSPPNASPDDETASPATAEPTTTQAPGTTPAATPIQLPPAVDIDGWQLQEGGGFGPADTVSAVVAGSTGGLAGQLFAVGSSDEAETGVAAAWRSSDGATWARLDLPDASDAALQAVADGPGGLVAVGLTYATELPQPAIWRSTDGQAWQRVTDPALGGGEMRVLAAGPGGYLALGVEAEGEGPTMAWRSADGLSWSAPAAVAAIPSGATINGLLASQHGYLAFGALPPDVASEQAAIWLSADGSSWEQLELPGPPGGVVNDIVATDSLLVAVGAVYRDDLGHALSWVSTNGREWELTADGATDGALFGVAAHGAAFVAVGAVELADFRFDAAVWLSADGRAWAPMAAEPSFRQARLYDLLPVGGRLAAVGERGLDELAEELAPAVWLSHSE